MQVFQGCGQRQPRRIQSAPADGLALAHGAERAGLVGRGIESGRGRAERRRGIWTQAGGGVVGQFHDIVEPAAVSPRPACRCHETIVGAGNRLEPLDAGELTVVLALVSLEAIAAEDLDRAIESMTLRASQTSHSCAANAPQHFVVGIEGLTAMILSPMGRTPDTTRLAPDPAARLGR